MKFTTGQIFFFWLAVSLFALCQVLVLAKCFNITSLTFAGLEPDQTRTLVLKVFGLMLAVLVAMFADMQDVFPSVPKEYSRTAYYAILLTMIRITYLSRQPIPEPRNAGNKSLREQQLDLVLNREQTEEWKGWLQFAFILYHYTGGHESYVYYPVRVYVSCYVWLTGYGNFLYFYQRGDYSFRRVLKMMIRINLLITLALLALPEIEYMRLYICPLHSIFFLMVYAIMRVQADRNKETSFMITKLIVALGVLIFIHEVMSNEMFDLFWSPLKPLLQYKGEMREWHFRFSLDGYATWFGMVCAFVVTKLKAQSEDPISPDVVKKAAKIAILGLVAWIAVSFPFTKHTFVRIHRYSSLMAISAYLVLRNATPALRKYYIPPLAWIGRHSLEIYILQCQLFMNHNGEAHLSWVPTYPTVSLGINGAIVFYFAHLANAGTLAFNDFFIPSKKGWTYIIRHRWIPVFGVLLLVLGITQL